MDNAQLDSHQISCSGKDELPAVASRLLEFAGAIRVWLFVGELGAGKTTLIKELCSQLGVSDEVSSPTFSIVNEYRNDRQKPVYHFDFYRIKDIEEAIDIGVGEYFYSGNYCFIEWPQKIEGLLPDDFLIIRIEGIENEKRVFDLTKYE